MPLAVGRHVLTVQEIWPIKPEAMQYQPGARFHSRRGGKEREESRRGKRRGKVMAANTEANVRCGNIISRTGEMVFRRPESVQQEERSGNGFRQREFRSVLMGDDHLGGTRQGE